MNGHTRTRRPSTLRARLAMVMPDRADREVQVELSYRTGDPYALQLTFVFDDSPAVEWVCARDLFREGLALPSGGGDVRVSPAGDTLIIELIAPQGTAVLEANYAPVARFVERMYAAVPEGTEGEHYVFDQELELLG